MALTENDPVEVPTTPPVELTLSQLPPVCVCACTVKFTLPILLETVTAWLEGVATDAPWIALKESSCGDNDSADVPPIVRITGTVIWLATQPVSL